MEKFTTQAPNTVLQKLFLTHAAGGQRTILKTEYYLKWLIFNSFWIFF